MYCFFLNQTMDIAIIKTSKYCYWNGKQTKNTKKGKIYIAPKFWWLEKTTEIKKNALTLPSSGTKSFRSFKWTPLQFNTPIRHRNDRNTQIKNAKFRVFVQLSKWPSCRWQQIHFQIYIKLTLKYRQHLNVEYVIKIKTKHYIYESNN